MTLVDQIFAAMDDVRALCGTNRHLVEDKIINELVEFASNGRSTPAFEQTDGTMVEPRALVVPSDPKASARYPHEPAAPTGKKGCERCGLAFGPSGGGSLPDHYDNGLEGRDGTRHTVWVPSGGVAVEIVMCSVCAALFNQGTAPVEWR